MAKTLISPLPDTLIEPIIRMALAEDLGRGGDVTGGCIPADAKLSLVFAARKPGVISGLDCARLAILAMDPAAVFEALFDDGDTVKAGKKLAKVKGNARALLTAERTALNLFGRMCGVATLTASFVSAVEGTGARITDTRKTTPGLRALEKYAVRCGGGINHRFGLDDAVLIKDNHVAACGGVGPALAFFRGANAAGRLGHLIKVEVEVDSLAQLEEALPYGPDVIMLDNFSLEDLRAAVALAKGAVTLEASGGVDLTTVRAIAETGVDVISVGALTHSAPVLDIGLDAA